MLINVLCNKTFLIDSLLPPQLLLTGSRYQCDYKICCNTMYVLHKLIINNNK